LRHELLPALRERYNTGVDDALLRLAAQAGEAQSVIKRLAEELACRCVRVGRPPAESASSVATRAFVDCRPLSAASPLLAGEVCKIAWQQAGWPLQAMGFEEWQQLAALIHEKRNSSASFSGNIHARREGSVLFLESHG
jgi:hypothetical protein